MLKPALQSIPKVKLAINIGGCLDIMTGDYFKGRYGESILNGGLSLLTGVVGHGNSFKSTITNYMMFSAMAKVENSTANVYDTEVNVSEARLVTLASHVEGLKNENLIENGRLIVTDKTVYNGDEYFDNMKEYMEAKGKEGEKLKKETPFLDRDRKSYQKTIAPTFSIVDSISEFTTSDVIKMQDENSLGESGGNTIFMRQGIQKNRFLMELPRLCGNSHNFYLMTAHIGNEFNLDPRAPAPKKLQHLSGGIKIKGVPEKFSFLMHNCWHAYSASLLVNQNTKAPEYPADGEDNTQGDTDLNIVRVRQLRGKFGGSGFTIELVVSQREGLLPTLTEFHFIKTHGRFGFEGNDRNYSICLLPEVKLSRTTVRGKIDQDPLLRRAINIVSELCQINLFRKDYQDYSCTAEELYNDIKNLGYDWDILLNTRGWYCIGNVEGSELPFLSTMDLLRMRKKEYVPYWYPKDKIPETVKDVPMEKVF